MLSELLVESFYAYIPESRGSQHPLARPSQRLTYAIKDGRKLNRPGRGMVSAYTLAAERVVANLLPDSILRSTPVLVPVPSSTKPPPVSGPHHFVSREIALALRVAGLPCVVEPLLERIESVPKASGGGPRDALVHRRTLGVVDGALPPQGPVVLLDDVTTTGAQLLGAAMRLMDAFPGLKDVTSFALVRAVKEEEFVQIHDPVLRRTRLLHPGTSGACSFGSAHA